MMRHDRVEHRFVKHVPEVLEPGVLYVSMEYATAVHSCCCGCGEEVVTPLTPTDWKMTFDGETISLWPSIGNWNFRCRSHYVIDRSQVRESLRWTDEQVAAGRNRDREAKAEYYANGHAEGDVKRSPALPSPRSRAADWWSSVKRWWST